MKFKFVKRIVPMVLSTVMLISPMAVYADDVEVPQQIESVVEDTVVESPEVQIEEINEIVEEINTQEVAEGIAVQMETYMAPAEESVMLMAEAPVVEEPEEVDPEVENVQIGIRVPDGFAVEFGFQASYKHTYIAESVDQNNVWVFNIQNDKGNDLASGNFFYRVYSVEENNDAVTYWGWLTAAEFKSAKGSIIEVTEEDLCINDEGKTKEVEVPILNQAGQDTGEVETKVVSIERNANTVDNYLENNQYDTQDILITGNQNGYVNLKVGDTWTLNCYRMWEIIESFMNAQISQPDFHIEAVGVDGNPTDVISITKNTGDGSANTITALSKGTVMLKITYDAVTVDGAMGGNYFSAIAPENTAVFVISVEGADVNDGIDLDAEVDVQYYTGNDGASIVAVPDNGSKVRVSRCGYNDYTGKLELSLFEDVESNDNGEFIIDNLREGSSVVEVEDSEGNKSYQVIKTKQMNFIVYDSEGEVITDMSTVEAGDTITIVADKFYDVFMKSAGVYNGSSCLEFTDNYGNVFKSAENAKGFAISYDQAGNPVYRTVVVTVPEDYDGGDYELTCSVYRNTRFGLKLTGHRTVYKNTGETKVNGYVVTTAAAASESEAGVIIDKETELLKQVTTERSHNWIGTEILSGEVVTMNNSEVEYKNIVE